MMINTGDLVEIRLSDTRGNKNVWFRVEEINTEQNKFIGKLERCECDFERYNKG
jgi:hypothetical protein